MWLWGNGHREGSESHRGVVGHWGPPTLTGDPCPAGMVPVGSSTEAFPSIKAGPAVTALLVGQMDLKMFLKSLNVIPITVY